MSKHYKANEEAGSKFEASLRTWNVKYEGRAHRATIVLTVCVCLAFASKAKERATTEAEAVGVPAGRGDDADLVGNGVKAEVLSQQDDALL